MDIDKEILNLTGKVSSLTEQIKNLEVHFTNHLHRHWVDRVLNGIYFLIAVLCFCYIKWG